MKKLTSFLLIAVMLLAIIPIGLMYVDASTYNPEAAIAYAAAHATDTPEITGADCANFVSKCVTAGGISVSEKVCHNLMLALKPYAATVTSLEIVMSNGYGRVPTSGSNAGILSKGDVMFVCCERCKSTGNNYERHAVLYSGESDSSGYAKCYAHTSMANNTTFWVGYNGTYACSNGHATSFLAAEVVHFGSTTPIVTSISPSSPYAIVGDNVTFSFPAVNATKYELVITNITVGIRVMYTMVDVSNFRFNFTEPGLYLIEVNAYGQSIVGFESIYFEVHSGNRPETYINAQKGEVYLPIQQATIAHSGEMQEQLQEAILYIYKAGVGLYYKGSMMGNGLYTRTFEEGSYEANVLLTYKSGYGLYTQTIRWHVGKAPSNVALMQTDNECIVGNNITFTVTANDATQYYLGIGNGIDVLYEKTSDNNTFTYTFNQQGTYYVWGNAINIYGTTLSSPDHLTVNVTEEKYIVTYNANGGDGAPENQIKYRNIELTLSNVKPTRVGYTFLGWSTSFTAISATYQAGDSFASNVDTTLYAVWEKGCENGAHSYVDVVLGPACIETGYTTHTCSVCGDTYTDSYVPALGHDDGEWETLDDGSKELCCTVCGELLDTEPAPEPDVLLGDVNMDGAVDMFDYLMVKSFYFEVTIPTDDQFVRADMNQDGVIDMFDYLMVKTAYFDS